MIIWPLTRKTLLQYTFMQWGNMMKNQNGCRVEKLIALYTIMKSDLRYAYFYSELILYMVTMLLILGSDTNIPYL